jgi:adenylate cyclase
MGAVSQRPVARESVEAILRWAIINHISFIKGEIGMEEQHHVHMMTQDEWRSILMGDAPGLRQGRRFFSLIPSNPRCKLCNAPFRGFGGLLMRLTGRRQFNKNPNFCTRCLSASEPGIGVELDIAMLFADIRGSTGLAENMSATEFSRSMNRFYKAASDVLIKTDAWIDKLVGDEIIGLYIPGFAGPDYSRHAVEAARSLLAATAYVAPVGVGVHFGKVFVGMVGSEGGVSDLTALGDNMNIAARLASNAAAGEALISEPAVTAAGIDAGSLEQRMLQLKGRSESVPVRVIRHLN